MSVKKLVKSEHPIFNQPANPVEHFDDQLKQTLMDIEDSLYALEGSALCANQIGINQQVAIVDMEMEGLLQLINPKIKNQSDETITDLEGSVSLPNVFGEVERSKMIIVESNDVNGNTVELTAYDDVARMILHTIDQLNGIFFTEKAKRILSEEEMEAYFEYE
ncbi:MULTISPECIES: peptide deformylase [Staphylococcus]|uniref:peptide deformylase n=1 Tax=Staphylococcus TaxID=1279 RepID=UPI0002462F21|nr:MULTISPECIES: peptide deformylase [Staphylococcus]QAV31562.1 peptide deformylase [Sulfitobacter donghicola]AGZ26538.1 peptide deformylase [Staphylococcus pasteuri SP1]KAB7647239.1 peptide deformylase [Staphylococcus sp. B2-b]MBN6851974.1 peptide deformylase [Staphylococcus warneri]MBT2769237.1 peptide deformylase [Staphylococcus warneri]